MKKSLIGTLALGLVIGVGALGVKAFTNEKEVATQSFTTNVNPVVSNIDQNSSAQGESQFKVLNKETNKFEKLDDSEYRNYNARQSCPHINYGSYGDIN